MPCSHIPPADVPDPLRVEEAWLTETVLLLARGVAADVAFDRLPILADALEEAGCDNSALLNHLRSDEPHRVECWALRRLLRTTLVLPGGVEMAFAWCPPGSFLMGSPDSEADRSNDEQQHQVTLTRGFYAGIHPVTQAQWRAVMGTTPSRFKGDALPVDWVSWEDAKAFCQKVRELTDKAVRLPTEAEWEYACRAGTTTVFHFGDVLTDQLANFNATGSWKDSPAGEYRGETTAVGTFPSNPWGLFDCHGNVWEWCEDCYKADFYARSPADDPECRDGEQKFRVLRSDSFADFPSGCRAARRNGRSPAGSNPSFGFRVVFCLD